MKTTIFALLLSCCCAVNLTSQNLIPNGSFEKVPSIQGTLPFEAFPLVEDWYAASRRIADNIYTGTPDLFDDDFPRPFVEPLNYWNKMQGAADGTVYVGIVSVFQYEGYSNSEAIATPLTEPLEEGALYHIGMKVRNLGIDNNGELPELCVPLRYKKMNVLLESDIIKIFNDPNNDTSFTSSPIIFSLSNAFLKDQVPRNWEHLGSCFKAKGTERHLGISMPIGAFEVEPPCVFEDKYWKSFYSFYCNIDDVQLVKLPETIQVEAELCKGRPTKINIHDLSGLPIMQNPIQYEWEDGRVDTINYLTEAGTYRINAQFDCGTIPITLEVSDIKCDPHIFVPNAFTPNFDGYNDVLETFIVVDLPILEYKFSVFDRWGTMVFTSQNINDAWDGTAKGQQMSTGVYVWLLEYTIDDIEKGIINYKSTGDVTLFKDRDY